MQDEAISRLRDAMREAAYKDADCVNNGQPAINKLSLLSTVRDVLLRANLADSILDNNLLESVRLWLEPLPDASLPAYEIQRTLIEALPQLPIKTIHLRESGLGKVMIFYQKSKRVEPNLKRICEKLIGDWTRAIMGRSDNYRDKSIKQVDYSYFKHKADIPTQARTQQIVNANKSLYEESAARRNRAAAPAARTTAYKVAPRANLAGINSRNKRTLPSGVGTALNKDERFKSLSQRLHSMGIKKKGAKKGGVSIEGKGISM
ncbi:hypothetical protein PACTADRAFT_121 [Pachysolen tannophilus NRRL Y-2460]|uniref:TFIIS N-terminal domain-containing protein n=1 Tax=Pachysolen tannophilus NRRL Y-2460 TaxID=669874 RepID=A0A1E4U0S9_PACTA|nr:hypothetical protein PACTADRAFT_121 [Pachysolen tannophilus NRRL Y-2460]